MAFIALLLVAGVGGVAAQDGDGGIDNPMDENETQTEEEQEGDRIDDTTTLRNWSYDDDEQVFTLEIHAEERTTVTITEAVSGSDGSGRMSIEQVRLSEGTQTIRFRVQDDDEPAVAMTTSESIKQGHGTYIAAGPDDLPLPQVNLGYGVGVGIAVMVVGMSIAVYRKRSVEYQEVESGWT